MTKKTATDRKIIVFALPSDQVKKLDKVAKKLSSSRSTAIRYLLMKGLETQRHLNLKELNA